MDDIRAGQKWKCRGGDIAHIKSASEEIEGCLECSPLPCRWSSAGTFLSAGALNRAGCADHPFDLIELWEDENPEIEITPGQQWRCRNGEIAFIETVHTTEPDTTKVAGHMIETGRWVRWSLSGRVRPRLGEIPNTGGHPWDLVELLPKVEIKDRRALKREAETLVLIGMMRADIAFLKKTVSTIFEHIKGYPPSSTTVVRGETSPQNVPVPHYVSETPLDDGSPDPQEGKHD